MKNVSKMKNVKVMMMTLMMCLMTIFIVSCGQKSSKDTELRVFNEGKTIVENGRGNMDSIPYKCEGCVENLTYNMFDNVIKESSKIAKNNLKNPLSFKPISMDIDISNTNQGKVIKDSLYVTINYNYIGQNDYGTELSGEHLITFTLVNGSVIDILIFPSGSELVINQVQEDNYVPSNEDLEDLEKKVDSILNGHSSKR